MNRRQIAVAFIPLGLCLSLVSNTRAQAPTVNGAHPGRASFSGNTPRFILRFAQPVYQTGQCAQLYLAVHSSAVLKPELLPLQVEIAVGNSGTAIDRITVTMHSEGHREYTLPDCVNLLNTRTATRFRVYTYSQVRPWVRSPAERPAT
jgi:hypothetical protein